MEEKQFIIHHKYSDGSGSGALPFLVTEREKLIIEKVREAINCYCQDLTFVEVQA